MLFSCRSQISQLGKYLPCWCAYLQMLKVAPKNEKCPSLCLSTELVETVVSQHCDHTARIRDHTSGAIRPGPPMFSPKWHQSGSPKQKPNPRAISPSGVSDDPQITDVVSTLVCDPCVKHKRPHLSEPGLRLPAFRPLVQPPIRLSWCRAGICQSV